MKPKQELKVDYVAQAKKDYLFSIIALSNFLLVYWMESLLGRS
jgi:hypothetical protein